MKSYWKHLRINNFPVAFKRVDPAGAIFHCGHILHAFIYVSL